jgi:hypothetical protein
MGLDATVYCNCFESRKLKVLPLFIDLIFVDSDGSLACKSEDLDTLLEFDQWLYSRACEHKNGILLHHRIGNIALVALLRKELSPESEKFPIILQKIIYNGIHGGDYLSLTFIENLQNELDYLTDFICSSEGNQAFVNDFRRQLIELTNAALQVGKPISF